MRESNDSIATSEVEQGDEMTTLYCDYISSTLGETCGCTYTHAPFSDYGVFSIGWLGEGRLIFELVECIFLCKDF